jgi:tRNA-modifying protein YgfZ
MSLPDAIFYLEGRARFRLTGADRVRYLNGQCTNDIRQASSEKTLYALITDHKARIAADIFVHAEGESLIVDAESHLREVLAARLERYIIADDVTLTDESDDWRLYHVTGDARQGLEGITSSRLGEPGLDVWCSVNEAQLEATEHDFEVQRILAGIPRHPSELNEEVFPADAGLEERAVSFTKGCYIGQEVISRIQSTGKHPKELIRLVGAGLEAGMKLRLAAQPERDIGSITSVTKDAALGYIKPGEVTADSKLLAFGGAPTIAVQVSLFQNRP